MSTVTKEIMNLARKAGYEGEDKTNVTKAIDALADTLAGENLEQATNVAAAIRKLQPYVGGDGSGGDSDFTTAEVTLVNGTSSNLAVLIPFAYEEDPPDPPGIIGVRQLFPNETATLKVPLYKGYGYAYGGISGDKVQGVLVARTLVITSGEATAEGNFVTITGDCTITAS